MVQMALLMVQVDREQAPWHQAASTICCCRCGKFLFVKDEGMVSCRIKPKGAVVLWHTDVAIGCRKALILLDVLWHTDVANSCGKAEGHPGSD